MDAEHGHSPSEITRRIGAPPGRGLLRDAVYGGIDGSVTTFAIVAGVAGAGLSPFVIVALGVANVLADGFSMAAANYSGAKAEADNIRRIRAIEERHIRLYPEGERREVREILAQKGLSGAVLEEATDAITRKHDKWIDLMIEGEYGLGGIDPHPLRAALATFFAFLLAGLIPLVPFLLGLSGGFALSAVVTGMVFFAIGALKSRWSLSAWWRSGLETLLIGGTAALIAYGVGTLFHG
ncbi:Predicted Fe2+/Mn2+ transporter, VIT1/CCC1 family [Cribrihabitans marinus]|uniref:Predicted Fe2+/Mn2+ transporter, VIT1/CCC1 family n=1 Tax=Cribrihabitans marinus TaxID=1227549 RepID=A0A1H7BI48_9RHOB|nr:VIT1/CCC1 transporter family protein [Cribrihabitans marinus]GGH34507.1 membrane protein [Cribrihabitans marinus]SEJ76876.1 Predicted Fe2+/Mn2+ transporter, VIT1/CCC1 family [Cribrihabitans marinus]